MTFDKYKKIKILGHSDNQGIFDDSNDNIVIEEKIDGANFRFMIKDRVIIFGSRTQELHQDKEEQYSKNFNRCCNHVEKQIRKAENNGINLADYENMIFYGECCVKHSINYDWETMPPYLGFDIWINKEERFLEADFAASFFQILGLDFVPIINICKANEIKAVDDDFVPQSIYSLNKAEGVVFKNYNKQIFAKYVTDKFKETNKETFGMSKKFASSDDEYVTAVYCTNARIEKMIFKLIDEEVKLEMQMMKFLSTRVYKDIWEEHWNEIAHLKGRSVNFQKFRRRVTNRCCSVLKQIIVNTALAAGDKQNE